MAVPRVQETTHTRTENYEYIDPGASVIRSMAKRMETNPNLKVDEVQPPRGSKFLGWTEQWTKQQKQPLQRGRNEF